MRNIGISYSGYHDSSVCFLDGSKVEFALSEERITRICHDRQFPMHAIETGMKYLGWKASEVSNVVLSWQSPLRNFVHQLQVLPHEYLSARSLLDFARSHLRYTYTSGGLRNYQRRYGKARCAFCDHHLAHAISAFSFSGFDEACVVIVDGRGAHESTSFWHGRDGVLTPVSLIRWPDSIGLFYAKFTKYLGFAPLSDEWKVMGLAAYGKAKEDLSQFIDLSGELPRVNYSAFYGRGLLDVSGIERVLGPARQDDEEITDRHRDIAFAVQQAAEQALLKIVRYGVSQTKCRNLCLAGGVALNCKANGKVVDSGLIDRIFVQPAASDEGTALGAALYPYLQLEQKLPRIDFAHCYLGPEFNNEEIERTLKSYKLNYRNIGTERARVIAAELAQGKIVGHFRGRMEFGPRALGNRSILADPRQAEMKDKVNMSVKYREWWRPFAPSMLEEHYHDYFAARALSPFMILSFPVNAAKEAQIPAAVHVDQTARPQSVSKSTNPEYWELINDFYKQTGVPVVLNTSFNLKGEPIVCSPFDAIRTFYTSGLDTLAIGDFLVQKDGA